MIPPPPAGVGLVDMQDVVGGRAARLPGFGLARADHLARVLAHEGAPRQPRSQTAEQTQPLAPRRSCEERPAARRRSNLHFTKVRCVAQLFCFKIGSLINQTYYGQLPSLGNSYASLPPEVPSRGPAARLCWSIRRGRICTSGCTPGRAATTPASGKAGSPRRSSCPDCAEDRSTLHC